MLIKLDLGTHNVSKAEQCGTQVEGASVERSNLFFHDKSLYVSDSTNCAIVGEQFSQGTSTYDFHQQATKELSFYSSMVFFNAFGTIYKTDAKTLTKIDETKV
jgi:hypothetical protein